MAESPQLPKPKDIFLKALDILAVTDRAAFLTQACGADESLRRQIEAMLEAHAKPNSFLEKPAAAMGATVDASGEPPLATVLPDAQIGARIGPYKLLEQIGEGGMGAVFMAEQQEPVRRMVALKLIKPGMDSGQVLVRFEAERQALALMDHPNIARVLDAGATKEGRPFFVMELVKGTPITKFCDDRRLSPRERLELFVLVCQAIQHAHQKGVIHRDIKPSNVLVALYDDKPVPKVIDFGVAKAAGQLLTEKTLNTSFGAIVGTPEYMSPEQATFNQLDVDTRSDVYALGVLLYELLTGSTPVDKTRLKEAALLEVLRIVREEDPPRPSIKLSTSKASGTIAKTCGVEVAELSRLLRGELDWIVMKSLEKDRNRRYDTAASLARDVVRYLKDEMVEARPPSLGYRIGKVVRKNRGLVSAAAVVFLALLGGVTATTLAMLRAWDAEEKTADANETIQANVVELKGLAFGLTKARDEALANERTAKHQKLRAETARHAIQIELALRAWKSNDILEAERVLDSVGEAFQPTWETRHLRHLCRRRDRMLGGADWDGFVNISDDGKRIVVAHRKDHLVRIWEPDSGRILGEQRETSYVCDASMDARRVAGFSPDKSIRVWDTDTGKAILSLKQEPMGPHPIGISRDGSLLVVGGPANIKLVDIATGMTRKSFNVQSVGHEVAISRDGRRVLAGYEVWDAVTGQKLFTPPGPHITATALSGDGQWLIACSTKTGRKVWHIDTGKERVTLQGIPKYDERVAFSGDGRLIVATGLTLGARHEEMVSVWDAATGVERFNLRGHPRGVLNAAINGDGTRVVTTGMDRTVRVWDLPPNQEQNLGKNPKKAILNLQFAGAGRHLIAVSYDDSRTVWDVTTGQMVPGFEGHSTCCFQRVKNNNHSMREIKADGSFLVWDLAGQPRRIFHGHRTEASAAAISADGTHIVSGDLDGVLCIWSATKAEPLRRFVGHTMRVASVAIDKAGSRFISASKDGTVKIWDRATGAEVRTLKGHQDCVNNVAISADGARIVSGSDDKTARIWDVETGRELFSLTGHSDRVESVAFSPDGHRVVTGSADKTVKVWDAATGQEVLNLKGHTVAVLNVTFNPEGDRIASSDEGGNVKVWHAP